MNPEPPSDPTNPPKPKPEYGEPDKTIDTKLAVMQPGEQVICQIKRHPIGIISNYVVSGFVIVIIAALLLGVAPRLSPNSSQINSITSVVLIIVVVIGALYNLIGTIVYWGNRWVVTSDSITQIEQTGLFTTKASQLSLENIEDVTAEQNGLLTHMFNFGLLKAETAGHHGKFVFLYCPNPNFYATKILEAREAFALHAHQAQQPPLPPTPPNYS